MRLVLKNGDQLEPDRSVPARHLLQELEIQVMSLTPLGHTRPPGLAEPVMILEYQGDWNGLWCRCLVSSGGVYQKGAGWHLKFCRVTTFFSGA